MAKITRKTAIIFASGSANTDMEQFGSKVQTGTPNYTNDPAVIQELSAWTTGWSAALVASNSSEYKQDRNAVDYVMSYQVAYILEMGIPEWDSGTTYYTNSIVQYGGIFYISLVDANLGNTPPAASNTYWRNLMAQPTQTVLKSGSGTYTPPVGCVYMVARMVGGGGGGGSGGGNGGNSIFIANAGGGNGGAGGTGGTGYGSNITVNISGAYGYSTGGAGGSSPFGGAGSGSAPGATNSGSGGGGGGGAGAYLEIGAGASPISYVVGSGGSAGSGGGAGGSGIIIIQEFYY